MNSDTDFPAKRSVPSFKSIVPAPYSHGHTGIRSASILPSFSSPLTPDPSPTMTPDNPKHGSRRDSGSVSLAATREYSASIVGQSPSFKPTGGQQLPAISDLHKTTAMSSSSSARTIHSHPPSGTPPMSPALAMVSPVPRPHCGITDPSQYSSSSGFYQLPPPLQPFATRQSPHQSPAMRPQSSQSHSLPPLPPLPSPSVHANGYSPRSTPQMSPLPNHYMVSPAIAPLSPYPTPQYQPRQYSSPHMDPLAPKQSIPAMALPASVLSSSSTSHEVTSRSYSTILPRRASEQSSPTSAPVGDRSAPGSPRRFTMLPPPSTSTPATTSPSSPSKAEAATPSTLLSLKPSRSQARKSASGSGSGSTATTTRRRGSSNAKLVDQETRDLMRKVSHSAIERRRRERINDKILQLKHLVPACVDEDHLHKLSILQSTIEYIQHLKSFLPASVANIKVGRATNNNPNNKTTDVLDAMGGSISAKSPLTPLMTTGLNHFHAKRIKVDKPDIRALLEEHSPGFVSSSSDEDAKDGLLLLARQSTESTTDQSSRHDHKRVLRKKRSME